MNRLIVILLFISRFAYAQDILEGYVSQGLNNNHEISNLALELNAGKLKVSEAKSNFLPRLSFNSSYLRADGGRIIEFPAGDLLNPINATLNSIIDQPAFPTNIPNLSEQLNPSDFHNTYLEVGIPLINPQSIHLLKARQKSIQTQTQGLELKRLEIARKIKTAYFTYLQAHQAESYVSASIELINRALKTVESLHKHGKAGIEKVYEVRYQKESVLTRQLEAQNNTTLTKAQFNLLLNRSLNEEVLIDPFYQEFGNILTSDSLETPDLSARPELTLIREKQAVLKELAHTHQAAVLPQINAGIQGGYQGFGYKFDDTQDFWLAKISLKWNLYSGSANRSKYLQTKIQDEQLENVLHHTHKQLQLKFYELQKNLDVSAQQYKSAKIRLELIEKTFSIHDKKYNMGQLNFQDWLSSFTELTQTQTQLTIFYYNYLKQLEEMHWITHF